MRGLDGPVRVLNSCFLVRGARRRGVGLRAVCAVLTGHPGAREVAFRRDARPPWPSPERPELPPDVWLSFHVGAAVPPFETRRVHRTVH